MNIFLKGNQALRHGQKGAITMISAVLILILLTEMMIYAVHTGVFEQRKSGNELRQKIAFNMADSAIQEAKQFMLINSVLISSSKADLLPDGTDGWLANTGEKRWVSCAGITDQTHPCFAESNAAMRAASYYYSFNNANTLPLNPEALALLAAGGDSSTDKVTLYALLCMLDLDRTRDPVVQGCTTDAAKQDGRYFLVTLAARGEADCLDNGTNCKAEALVSDKIGSFGPGGGDGGPGVPLAARTAVPLLGTVEIVPNPNGGGVGVPISTWINANAACPTNGDPINPQSGSYSTCERHEWYGVADFPSDYKCPTSNCACKKGEDKLLSYAQGNDKILGIDVVIDPQFPCDIFKYTFGVPKTEWQTVKAMVAPSKQLNSCDSLGVNSFGFYWVSGDCDIKSNSTIGSVNAPVFLVVSGEVTMHGDMFGVLFVTDVEDAGAEFTGNGHGTIYGAAVMDAEMEHFNGTFQIVYLDNVINQAIDTGAFGAVQGGWTDFHANWK
jgi:Tfp pilus assembly protein PilX